MKIAIHTNNVKCLLCLALCKVNKEKKRKAPVPAEDNFKHQGTCPLHYWTILDLLDTSDMPGCAETMDTQE